MSGDRDVALDPLEEVVEVVGAALDVAAGALDGPDAVGEIGRAFRFREAHVLGEPALRRRRGQRRAHGADPDNQQPGQHPEPQSVDPVNHPVIAPR